MNSNNNYEDLIRETLVNTLEELALTEFDEFIESEKLKGNKIIRNGYRTKSLDTTNGEIKIKIPRDKSSSFFPSFLYKWCKYSVDLIKKIIINIKTNKSQSICIKELKNEGINVSRSFVQKIWQRFGELAEERYYARKLPSKIDAILLDGTQAKTLEYKHIETHIDHITGEFKTYISLRHTTVLQAFGINFEDNSKIDLGFFQCDREHENNYESFLEQIRNDGVEEIGLLVADNHPAIKKAMQIVYPECKNFQLCFIHAKRYVLSLVPHKENKYIIKEMFSYIKSSLNVEEVKEVIPKYVNLLSASERTKKTILDWMDRNLESIMTFKKFPIKNQKHIYTTNYIESQNKKIKLSAKRKGYSYNAETLKKSILISKCIDLKLI